MKSFLAFLQEYRSKLAVEEKKAIIAKELAKLRGYSENNISKLTRPSAIWTLNFILNIGNSISFFKKQYLILVENKNAKTRSLAEEALLLLFAGDEEVTERLVKKAQNKIDPNKTSTNSEKQLLSTSHLAKEGFMTLAKIGTPSCLPKMVPITISYINNSNINSSLFSACVLALERFRKLSSVARQFPVLSGPAAPHSPSSLKTPKSNGPTCIVPNAFSSKAFLEQLSSIALPRIIQGLATSDPTTSLRIIQLLAMCLPILGVSDRKRVADEATSLLKKIVLDHVYHPLYVHHGVPCPFLQNALFRLLCSIPKEEVSVNLLAPVLSRVQLRSEITTNGPRSTATVSVLFSTLQLVERLMSLGGGGLLEDKALDLAARYISVQDANLRLLGIRLFGSLLKQAHIKERLLSYRHVMTALVTDEDPSIRLAAGRALFLSTTRKNYRETVTLLVTVLRGVRMGSPEEREFLIVWVFSVLKAFHVPSFVEEGGGLTESQEDTPEKTSFASLSLDSLESSSREGGSLDERAHRGNAPIDKRDSMKYYFQVLEKVVLLYGQKSVEEGLYQPLRMGEGRSYSSPSEDVSLLSSLMQFVAESFSFGLSQKGSLSEDRTIEREGDHLLRELERASFLLGIVRKRLEGGAGKANEKGDQRTSLKDFEFLLNPLWVKFICQATLGIIHEGSMVESISKAASRGGGPSNSKLVSSTAEFAEALFSLCTKILDCLRTHISILLDPHVLERVLISKAHLATLVSLLSIYTKDCWLSLGRLGSATTEPYNLLVQLSDLMSIESRNIFSMFKSSQSNPLDCSYTPSLRYYLRALETNQSLIQLASFHVKNCPISEGLWFLWVSGAKKGVASDAQEEILGKINRSSLCKKVSRYSQLLLEGERQSLSPKESTLSASAVADVLRRKTSIFLLLDREISNCDRLLEISYQDNGLLLATPQFEVNYLIHREVDDEYRQCLVKVALLWRRRGISDTLVEFEGNRDSGLLKDPELSCTTDKTKIVLDGNSDQVLQLFLFKFKPFEEMPKLKMSVGELPEGSKSSVVAYLPISQLHFFFVDKGMTNEEILGKWSELKATGQFSVESSFSMEFLHAQLERFFNLCKPSVDETNFLVGNGKFLDKSNDLLFELKVVKTSKASNFATFKCVSSSYNIVELFKVGVHHLMRIKGL